MEKNWLTKSSFTFGGIDMYERFGIMLENEPHDVILPPLRSRKMTIPQRHGAYDYGAKYYSERGLRLDCVTIRTIARADVREISFMLSTKSEIRIWNEPEKYYVGRIYDSAELDQLRTIGNKFKLTFICEPFAYGRSKTEYFTNRTYIPDYPGTAATSTYIVLTNVAASGNISNIKITQTDKEDNY